MFRCEDSETARGEHLVDPGAQLVVDEDEPVSAGPLPEHAEVCEVLEHLGELLLRHPARGDEEREVELVPDRAPVGEHPHLGGAERGEVRERRRRLLPFLRAHRSPSRKEGADP